MQGARISVGLICAAMAAMVALLSMQPSSAAEGPKLAYLGTFLQNDNEGLEPTTDAERARLARTGEDFAHKLADSGQFRIVAIPDEQKAAIAAGQMPGECGGCEADYGKKAGAELVAWIRVQKVSNLILNMNVYVVDVASGKQLLIKSVDLRGNTDESWARSLSYLVKNHVLPAELKPPAG